jgi:regulatory protein
MSEDHKEQRSARKRRGPKKVTPQHLERVALWYLDRWGSSSANLERVLLRRVHNSARLHGTDPEKGKRAVQALVARLQESGLLNDRLVAESKARGQFRKGQSLKAIATKLRQQGLGEEDVAAAIAGLEEASAAPNLEAAATYARRRRLGPYREEGEREERRERDLAALARRGFSFDTARKVIEAESVEALEDLLAEAAEF